MRKYQISRTDMISDHISDLLERFKSTVNPHEKNALRKRLINLQGVMQFLISDQTGIT
jgi:hypothetical protein